MRNLGLYILFFTTFCVQGQQIEKVVLAVKDEWNLYVNDEDADELFYLKLCPKNAPKGVVVIIPSGNEKTIDTLAQINLDEEAVDDGFIVLVPSINWGTEDRIPEFRILDLMFQQVVEEHNQLKDNFIIGGLSNGGMITLRYAETSVKDPSLTFLRPKGVFALDTPLDKVHLYEYCRREIKRNFSEAGINEARWIMNNYNNFFGGPPEEYPQKYIDASIYSYGVENGGNAKYLKDMPIRLYTDLDLEFLLDQRKRSLYDWNGTDMVAMINDLRLMGNMDANIIISMGKGVRLDGTKHPHSWPIMDTQDCMDWIKSLF